MKKLLTQTRSYESFFEIKLAKRAEGTRKQYHYALKDFEDYSKKKFNLNLEQMIEEFKASEIEQVIDTLQGWINKSSIELGNKKLRVNLLNNYFYYRGLKIDSRDMKDLEYENLMPQERKEIKLEWIEEILRHCKPHRKALYLSMLSSGMAIQEACYIKKSDIDTTEKRLKITIKPAYTKKSARGRVVFISKEAGKEVKALLKHKKDDDFVFHSSNDPRTTKENEMQCFRRIVDKFELGKKYDSGTRECTTHALRSYFASRAIQVHGENYQHKMLGHAGYLMQYDRYSEEKKLEMYLQLEPKLLIFETPVDMVEYNTMEKRISQIENKHEGFMEYIAKGLITIKESNDPKIKYTIDKTELHKVLKEIQQENNTLKTQKAKA